MKTLRAGLARLACLSDGRCAWLSQGEIVFGDLKEKDSPDASGTEFTLPRELDPSLKYEAGVSATMRSAERHTLGGNDLPEAYLRFFLPRMRLWVEGNEEIDAKVQIKLYSSGLVLLTFLVAETGEWQLDDFIERRVNLGFQTVTAVELDPAVAHLGLDAKAGETIPPWRRMRILKLRSLIRRNLGEKIRASGTESVRLEGSAGSQLAGIGFDLVRSLAYCLGNPRRGLPFLLRGEPQEPRWTGFWAASPHVHLMQFSDQQTSASKNEALHCSSFAQILARTSRSDFGAPRHLRNLRAFDDYGMYVNEATVLWTYALLTKEPKPLGTRQHPFWFPTFHNQVKGELIEIVPMLYRSLLHELDSQKVSWERVVSLWRQSIDFELSLTDAGRFGEVQDAIREGFKVRRAQELRNQAQHALALKERVASVREVRRLSAIGGALTVVIGLLSLPYFVEKTKVWLLPRMGLSTLSPFNQELVSWVVDLSALALILWLTTIVVGRQRGVRWQHKASRD